MPKVSPLQRAEPTVNSGTRNPVEQREPILKRNFNTSKELQEKKV